MVRGNIIFRGVLLMLFFFDSSSASPDLLIEKWFEKGFRRAIEIFIAFIPLFFMLGLCLIVLGAILFLSDISQRSGRSFIIWGIFFVVVTSAPAIT